MMRIEGFKKKIDTPLKAGRHTIEVTTEIEKPAAPGTVTFVVDGREVGKLEVKQTVPLAFTASETLDVGGSCKISVGKTGILQPIINISLPHKWYIKVSKINIIYAWEKAPGSACDKDKNQQNDENRIVSKVVQRHLSTLIDHYPSGSEKSVKRYDTPIQRLFCFGQFNVKPHSSF
jgi:hypothetical protein